MPGMRELPVGQIVSRSTTACPRVALPLSSWSWPCSVTAIHVFVITKKDLAALTFVAGPR